MCMCNVPHVHRQCVTYSVVAFQTRDSHIFLYTAAEDKCIRVWDLHTSQLVATLDLHYGVVTSLQFSADGRTMYR